MSLYEVSDGLLETHVTWEDVELEMQKALGTTAKFGENKKATNIADRKGFMSRIALIDPHWVGSDNISNLPQSFIVKISSQLSFIQIAQILGIALEKIKQVEELSRECHNREVNAYNFLAKLKNPHIPLIKIYAMKPFDKENRLKGFIIADFVPNAVHLGMHQDVAAQDLEVIVKALGALSASGEKFSEEELSFVKKADYIEVLIREIFDEKQVNGSMEKLQKAFPEDYQDKMRKYEQIFKAYYSHPVIVKKFTTISEYLGGKDVICHCDPWCSNFLFNKEEGRLVLKAIVDWQTLSKCNPAIDICRNLVACMSAEERALKKDHMIDLYYNSMLEELGENATPPYTLQQLHDSYRLHVPFMAFLVLPAIVPFLEYSEVSEEERPEVRRLAYSKMTGLLDEVLESHEYNIKKFPDFFDV